MDFIKDFFSWRRHKDSEHGSFKTPQANSPAMPYTHSGILRGDKCPEYGTPEHAEMVGPVFEHGRMRASHEYLMACMADKYD